MIETTSEIVTTQEKPTEIQKLKNELSRLETVGSTIKSMAETKNSWEASDLKKYNLMLQTFKSALESFLKRYESYKLADLKTNRRVAKDPMGAFDREHGVKQRFEVLDGLLKILPRMTETDFKKVQYRGQNVQRLSFAPPEEKVA